jgi:hypothetical protein
VNGSILHRAERSLLAGAAVGIVVTLVTLSHHHYATAAAASHSSTAAYLFHGILVVGGFTAGALFVLASIITASRNADRSRRGQPQRRRTRRADW